MSTLQEGGGEGRKKKRSDRNRERCSRRNGGVIRLTEKLAMGRI